MYNYTYRGHKRVNRIRFDEKGIYRGNSLMFDWSSVERISTYKSKVEQVISEARKNDVTVVVGGYYTSGMKHFGNTPEITTSAKVGVV